MAIEALRLPQVADLLKIGLYNCDTTGKVVAANNQCAQIWGRGFQDRLAGAWMTYASDGGSLAPAEDPVLRVLATQRPVTEYHLTIERPDGSRVDAQADAQPVFDLEGVLVGVACSLQEIAARLPGERGPAQKQPELTSHVLRQMLDALPTPIYATDATGRLTMYNKAAAEFAGRTPQIGVHHWCITWKLYEPDGTPLAREDCPMAIAIRQQKALVGPEVIAERPDGSRVRLMPYPTPIFDEEGRLTGAVNMLVDVTERREDTLQAARLAAIVASSDDAIVGKTLQGYVTSWNAGATRIFGYSAEEMIGQHITRIIPPELRAEEDQILSRLCRGEHIDHFETLRVAKDGRRIYVSLTVSPIQDSSGRLVGASKVGRDITERRQAEMIQRLLISELNHRVKNTLATVQSIANQTVRTAKSANDFATSFSGRIQALAKTHNLLTDTTWQGAELAAIIRDQLSVSESGDGRISFAGPAVMLSPQATLHLSLVLHELATNARKYGALSDPRGRLTIHWTVRAEEGKQLFLRWEESGGPLVRVPTTRGFGTSLIERSLDAHGGKSTMHYEAKGVTCDIVLPLLENENPAINILQRTYLPADDFLRLLPSSPPVSILSGKAVLVVDDEPLIAMDIAATLEAEGCSLVGPAASVERALGLIDNATIDAAFLDANLAGEQVDAVASALTRRNIPFAFVSGYGREGLPQAFQQVALIKKPFQREKLIDVLQRLLSVPEDMRLRRQP